MKVNSWQDALLLVVKFLLAGLAATVADQSLGAPVARAVQEVVGPAAPVPPPVNSGS